MTILIYTTPWRSCQYSWWFLVDDNDFKDNTLEEYDDQEIDVVDINSDNNDEHDVVSSDEELYILTH